MQPGTLAYDLAHLIGAVGLLAGLWLLMQTRLLGMIRVYGVQAIALGMAASWAGWVTGDPHLYLSAALAFGVKAVAIPFGLIWLVRKLKLEETAEPALSMGVTMVAGVGLVALAILVVRPLEGVAVGLTREQLGTALSMLLLGLLVMITRRNAISQVIGFMALENGVAFAAVGAAGMPMVVEMGVAVLVLIAFLLFSMFFFRIRERFDTLDLGALETWRGERQ
ncbi:MAG: hydrogenase-4 component E [Alphaproteobacteria bacterium]|nr:MAG: hydrogenase-4 component E [Alphaproteobacteria bacterium]